MPTRGKEWFSVVSTFTRLHGTEAVGCSLTFLFQVCSIHSGALSCFCVFRDGSEQVSGVPCLYVYVSELVNLLTLSDVCAGQVFMWKGLRERRPESVFFYRHIYLEVDFHWTSLIQFVSFLCSATMDLFTLWDPCAPCRRLPLK